VFLDDLVELFGVEAAGQQGDWIANIADGVVEVRALV
jgi:hypothetical protein